MHVWEATTQAWSQGQKAALVTIIGHDGSAPRHAGARMLVHADRTLVGSVGGGTLEYRLIEAALRVIQTRVPERVAVHLTRDLGMCCGGSVEAYIEPIESREKFVVFGAGHVAHALVPLLQSLDFDVHVVDEREEWLSEARFPNATRVLDDPTVVARRLEGAANAWWLIVTHDHGIDEQLCATLLPKTCAWIGMIGSRAKVTRFFLRLRAQGVDESLFSKLSAPVGVDLGAQTPAEIGISIAAEIVRVRRGGTALPLSDAPIAARGGDGTAHPPLSRRP